MLLNSILLQAQVASGGGAMQIGMIVLLIVIFYFFMIRPQNKKQKAIKNFRDGIQKGDKIITAGGVYGVVRDVKEKHIVLEIAEGVKISISKDAVYPMAEETQQK